uniref:Uncharacterized protein n=1 Tax=Timema bartmani TaxID=61472 RepID=A0A7R9I4W6_9NEOP|nr:unnamed protein product [Timema bartmani]
MIRKIKEVKGETVNIHNHVTVSTNEIIRDLIRSKNSKENCLQQGASVKQSADHKIRIKETKNHFVEKTTSRKGSGNLFNIIRHLEQCYNAGDQCPMYFDDGTNPWLQTENYIKVFHFGYYAGATLVFNSTLCLVLALMFYMCAWRRIKKRDILGICIVLIMFNNEEAQWLNDFIIMEIDKNKEKGKNKLTSANLMKKPQFDSFTATTVISIHNKKRIHVHLTRKLMEESTHIRVRSQIAVMSFKTKLKNK